MASTIDFASSSIAKKKVYSKSEPNYHFKKDELTLQTAMVGHNLFSHTLPLYLSSLIAAKIVCPFLFVYCGPGILI